MLEQLIAQRKNLQLEFDCLIHDLKEYIKNPCETVSIENIKGQIDFVLAQVKKINWEIKEVETKQFYDTIDALVLDCYKRGFNTKFTANHLPKLHHSMFKEPFI